MNLWLLSFGIWYFAAPSAALGVRNVCACDAPGGVRGSPAGSCSMEGLVRTYA